VDNHSRVFYTELFPDEEATPPAPAFLLRAGTWLKGHSVKPNLVMTDKGSAYRSHLLNTACRTLVAKPIKTRLYAPRTNSKAERFIQISLKEGAYAQVRNLSSEKSSPPALAGLLQHTAPTYRTEL